MLGLCLCGIAILYWQFAPWLREHGLNLPLFFAQLFANRIGAFFGVDVLVSAVVVLAFVGLERRRLSSTWWLPVVALLFCGVSAGLPLLLYLGERNESAS